MTDVRTLFENILRCSEKCTFAIELKKVKDTGKRKAHFLGIVVSRDVQTENAVFIMKSRSFGKAQLDSVIPITKEFSFRQKHDRTFVIRGVEAPETYECPTSNEMSQVVSALQTAHLIAMREDQVQGGATHHWLANYEGQVKKKKKPKKPSGQHQGEVDVTGGRGHEVPITYDTAGSSIRSNSPPQSPRGDSRSPTAPPRGILPGGKDPKQRAVSAKYNPNLFSYIREDWIKKQMRERESEYHEVQLIRVLVGTWNVNGKKPGESLSPWLDVDTNADIIVAGFQEIVDLTAGALLLDDISAQAHRQWVDHIDNCLNSKTDDDEHYVKISSKHLVGVLVCVFAKERHAAAITDVRSDCAGVGIMSIMGNKGGVATRFRFYSERLCFVCGHLAASKEHVERRNQDYMDIMRRVHFRDDTCAGILDHENVFWLGDFNYRLDLPYHEVCQKAADGDYVYLLKYDQLNVQRGLNKTFGPFTEGHIDFAPTYKYDPGTNNFDSSEKQRTPSWCDRILWKGDDIAQLYYKSFNLLTSDHKPVGSLFDVRVKMVVPEKQHLVYQEVMRMLDTWENECLPQVSVSQNLLDFSDVYLNQPVKRRITIENTGQVHCPFRFVAKLEETMVHKKWLKINPTMGLLIPNEKIEIELTILVDQHSCTDLNSGKETLEDTLILRLENGRDFFVALNGKYHKTCFGTSLEQLAQWEMPVRSSSCGQTGTLMAVPKELWRMVDYILQNGMDTDGIFMESGDPQEVMEIRNSLDTGEDFKEPRVRSMAEAVIAFLHMLPQPVVPYTMYSECIQNSEYGHRCRYLVDAFPHVHRMVFAYLISLLRDLLWHAAKNGVTVENLAAVFANAILRPPPDSKEINSGLSPPSGKSISQDLELQDMVQRKQFILTFLQTDWPDISEDSIRESF